ncbi:MAG TPA: hypothetical protein VMF52_20160, partial [Steroidobacteraceae bacterium]|nr:hypothetical protein [Steroidobacteraceae bacterium]
GPPRLFPTNDFETSYDAGVGSSPSSAGVVNPVSNVFGSAATSSAGNVFTYETNAAPDAPALAGMTDGSAAAAGGGGFATAPPLSLEESMQPAMATVAIPAITAPNNRIDLASMVIS